VALVNKRYLAEQSASKTTAWTHSGKGKVIMHLSSRLPDLIIRSLISAVVVRGGVLILHEAKRARIGEIDA
jgi:hypothetical protein